MSFHGGTGFDGLVHAAALLAFQDRVPVRVGLYLLALRHPVVVARQVADLERLFPGRLGVGVGGEDRHEFEAAGVDPSTRGSRIDEALGLLRRLLRGGEVTAHGRFFDLEAAVVTPAPGRPVPFLVGGRSAAALRRTAEHGDGWLGLWVSARRYAEALTHIAEQVRERGREDRVDQHGLSLWCSVPGADGRGAVRLAAAMERRYQLPFERFAKWCPVGEPAELAEFLVPYVGSGCRDVSLTFPPDEPGVALARAAEVRAELLTRVARSG